MTNLVPQLILQIILIALNAIFAAAEIAIISVNDAKLASMAAQGNKKAVRLARLGLVLAAIAAGFFGIGAALCLLLLHLAQIDSLGLNYTAPLSDGRPRPLKRLLPPSAREGTEARRAEP